jgi:hypothetical protein
MTNEIMDKNEIDKINKELRIKAGGFYKTKEKALCYFIESKLQKNFKNLLNELVQHFNNCRESIYLLLKHQIGVYEGSTESTVEDIGNSHNSLQLHISLVEKSFEDLKNIINELRKN